MELATFGNYTTVCMNQSSIRFIAASETGSIDTTIEGTRTVTVDNTPIIVNTYLTKFLKPACSILQLANQATIYFREASPIVIEYHTGGSIFMIQSISPVNVPDTAGFNGILLHAGS